MKVPLIAKSTKTNLRIYHNNSFVYANYPFQPFNLLEKSAFPDIAVSAPSTETWTKIPDDELTEYIRVKFSDTSLQREFLTRHTNLAQKIYKNNYLEQMYITDPNFIMKYPHETKLRIVFWDIETRTVGDNVFPKAETQPIICIGFSVWDYHPDGTKEKISYTLLNNYDEQKTDLYILQDFVKCIHDSDPDIIAGYNSESFDFPYFYKRCKIRKVSMAGFAREDKSPFISDQGTIYINGRIHYDMYLKVMKDQSLTNLKNKSLKTLARHYNVPLDEETDVELKDAIINTEKVRKENPELLWTYQEADVIRTEHTGAVYIRNDITLAEKVQVPLNDTMNSYASFIPKIFLARNFYENKLMSTETNFSKYNSRTGTKYQFRKSDNKELKYQGALVGLYKHGKFPDTYKLDFTSMYPSAEATFNLGPDTTKLIEVRPYTGKYGYSRQGKYDWHRVPDENFGVDLIVRVRNDIESVIKKEIKLLWAERAIIKAEMKKVGFDSLIYSTLDSQQLAIKVILNSIYGIQGLRSSTYGDTITGAMITAMCRWTTGKTIIKYESQLVELDTDGLAIDKRVSESGTNKWLDELMIESFGIDDNYMQMELDIVGPAYFCAMKNYVVEVEGHTHIHGSSLKSSRNCFIQDRARDLAIEHWFNSKPLDEVLREAYDFTGLTLKDFEYRVRLSKDIDEYDDKTGQVAFLAAQYEHLTETKPVVDTTIPYIISTKTLHDKKFKKFYQKKTGRNYKFIKLADDTDEIDLSYYNEQIAKMLNKFNIVRDGQATLFSSIGMDDIPDKVKLNKVNHDF